MIYIYFHVFVLKKTKNPSSCCILQDKTSSEALQLLLLYFIKQCLGVFARNVFWRCGLQLLFRKLLSKHL